MPKNKTGLPNIVRTVTERDGEWYMYCHELANGVVQGFCVLNGIDVDPDLAIEYLRAFFPDRPIQILVQIQ